ncbi:MAG TPA: branched-chain amino acid aminotransferase [Mycobacteriales bacterium]|jgi:branched-chain amino acid aminotransferase|nr:branched-chain amino acid aminotransferase [Mycobacteriales bacterium]
MGLEFSIESAPQPTTPERLAEILAAPGFGKYFTDHMVTVEWTPDARWHNARLRPYAPLSLDPATHVFHYGQAIFEGFKAYRQPDGGVATFRPGFNAERFNRSAARLALPELPVDAFVAASDHLVRADAAWVPSDGEASLYLRPFMMATEVGLGVKPASHVTFLVIASPVGPYFASGAKQVTIWLSEDYTRAAPGGTGAAKCSGNYAASLVAQQEGIANGCEQVLFLDATERRWVEELGGMNLWFVQDDGTLITPELTGTILEGGTRDALRTIAGELGHEVEERRVDIDEWRKGVDTGRITEVFACGTAAVIAPIGTLKWHGGEVTSPAENPVATKLRSALIDLQYGRSPDTHGWMHKVC